MKQFFAASNDTTYQEISQKLVIPKTIDENGKKLWDLGWSEYEDMVSNVTSTGEYACLLGNIEDNPAFLYVATQEKDWYKNWWRTAEPIIGDYPYTVHLSNKKWPLKKVL